VTTESVVPTSDVGRGGVSADSPWPGLAAFTEADEPFFYGRERICEELTSLIEHERLVVLHGRSGLGKTSLLQAGCFPKLREKSFLPVRIRFSFADQAPGPGSSTGTVPLVSQVRQFIEQAVQGAHGEGPALDLSATMWEWFQRTGANFWSERSRRLIPVLVFDQFESSSLWVGATPDKRKRPGSSSISSWTWLAVACRRPSCPDARRTPMRR